MVKMLGEPLFNKTLGDPDGSNRQAFWEWASSHDWGTEITSKLPRHIWRDLWPILFHIDGAEQHRNTEHHIWSWQSYFAKGSIWLVKILLTSIPNQMVLSKGLLDMFTEQVCKYIGFCMDILGSGELPTQGLYGEPLDIPKDALGSIRAAFAGLKADMKAMQQVNFTKRTANSTFLCMKCLAVQPFKNAPKFLSYANFNEDAPWVPTILDPKMHVILENTPSPFRHILGWTPELNFEDILHVTHLGPGRDIAAGCLIDLEAAGYLGLGDVDENLMVEKYRFKTYCKHLKTSCPKYMFTKRSLGRGSNQRDYPELASYFKAMHVKVAI
jgi:hypothetical protein